MSETLPPPAPEPATTVTATAEAASPPAAPAQPRTPKEAISALLEPQFLLSVVMMILVGRIIDSLLRNGNEGMQSQILMIATTILGFIGGAYFGANLAKTSSGGTTATATTAPPVAVLPAQKPAA